MRNLASVRTVSELRPIAGADAIELAIIDGWQVVVKKDEFRPGDPAIYFEIDSLLPANDPRFGFLASRGTSRNADGREGFRLRTIKLRGQISQGLALPAAQFQASIDEGIPLAEALGVVKYDPPIPAQLTGLVRGNFPAFLKKTDQERIQNRPWLAGSADTWEVTQKLDGSSMTVYFRDGEFGVCSRNIDLAETEGNTFWRVANALDLRQKMAIFGKNIALQGELIGENIQKNREQIHGHEFRLFDVWLIDRHEYMGANERDIAAEFFGVSQVPRLGFMTLEQFASVDEIIQFADGKSAINPVAMREGLVFKRIDGSDSFKAISNQYLLRHED